MPTTENQSWQVSTFETDLGWMLIAGCNQRLVRSMFGDATQTDIHSRLLLDIPDDFEIEDSEWNLELRTMLERFAEGEPIDFNDIKVDYSRKTTFQKRVLKATRKLSFGATATYGEIARQVGSPSAARAVGMTMAKNDCPLIIPCHRVVGAGGKMTGFTSPQGITMKKRLIEMEAGNGLFTSMSSS